MDSFPKKVKECCSLGVNFGMFTGRMFRPHAHRVTEEIAFPGRYAYIRKKAWEIYSTAAGHLVKKSH